LTSTFQTLLMEHFRATAPPADRQPFLTFELGTPIPDETFHLPPDNPEYSPALALEYMSHQANVAPRVQDDLLFETSNRIDNLYEILLMGATPTDAASLELLGHVKQTARASFDNTLGSLTSPAIERFHPVHADPINWYDQTENSNWTRLTLDRFDEPPPPPPPRPHSGGGGGSTGGGGGFRPGQLLMWRPAPADLRPLLSERVTTAGVNRFREHALVGIRRLAAEHAVSPRIAQPQRLGPLLADAPLVAAPGDAPPLVTSDGLSIEVEVCLVHLRRPWLADGLLNLTNWFVPAVAKGAFSAGAGPGDATPLAVLPVACVCIRNLALQARWNDSDREHVETSSHLGAFALLGRRFDHTTATLTVDGMQLIAWICHPMPVLPPSEPL
jgi:hypothetical protein